MSDALLWVAIGVLGAVGSLARFRVVYTVTARWPSDFPFGTFAVNVSGSFVLGVLTGSSLSGDVMFIMGTGLLGGYTTFSTWMVEARRLGEEEAWTLLWLYLFGSMLAGLAAAGGGWLLGGLAA
jgi:fluoride exporter